MKKPPTYQERPRKGGGTEIRLATDTASKDGIKWRRLLPVSFTAENAQKVHAGTKTQTRRLLNPQPEKMASHSFEHPSEAWWTIGDNTGRTWKPRYRVGDVLWIQEPWRANAKLDNVKPTALPQDCAIMFQKDELGRFSEGGKLRPGRFLPLRFARPHRYEVTAVRLERVNEISEADALAEGVGNPIGGCYFNFQAATPLPTARASFGSLWNSIQSAPGTRFEDAPWVFAYTFKQL